VCGMMSLPAHKLGHLPCYRFYTIKKYNMCMALSGMTVISSFLKICFLIQKFRWGTNACKGTHTQHLIIMILILSPMRRESKLKIGLRNSSSITAALKLFSPFLMCICVAEWRAESHTHSNTK